MNSLSGRDAGEKAEDTEKHDCAVAATQEEEAEEELVVAREAKVSEEADECSRAGAANGVILKEHAPDSQGPRAQMTEDKGESDGFGIGVSFGVIRFDGS